MEILQFLRDAEAEPTTDAADIMEIILQNEEKCRKKIRSDTLSNKSGSDFYPLRAGSSDLMSVTSHYVEPETH